ncbi:MAG: hypothetical protein M3Y51_00745, partial [Actinomycetota bacterium]|nr:hypothetical protein [Actinomycetota bacterium]
MSLDLPTLDLPTLELPNLELPNLELPTLDGTHRGQVAAAASPDVSGRVARVVGLTVETEGVDAAIGEVMMLSTRSAPAPVPAEVVALGDRGPVAMVLDEVQGLRIGDRVRATGSPLTT